MEHLILISLPINKSLPCIRKYGIRRIFFGFRLSQLCTLATIVMIYFLSAVFIIQMGLILYLSGKIKAERIQFRSKLKPLEDFIVQLEQENVSRSHQIRLSEELKLQLKEVNTALRKNIFDLNYQLFQDSCSKKER
ncbi:hypothetical protein [Flavobacterium sp.]